MNDKTQKTWVLKKAKKHKKYEIYLHKIKKTISNKTNNNKKIRLNLKYKKLKGDETEKKNLFL